MSCYICGMPETKLCDGILEKKLINSLTGACDRQMCDSHAKTVGTTFVCRRGKGKPTVITRDLCADCLSFYESKKS